MAIFKFMSYVLCTNLLDHVGSDAMDAHQDSLGDASLRQKDDLELDNADMSLNLRSRLHVFSKV